jgi:predicted dienelactone hydrolase
MNADRLLSLAGAMLLAMSTVAAQESISLPSPSGKFAVGRRLLEWRDASRGLRLVPVVLWYPSQQTRSRAAPYYPGTETLLRDSATRNELEGLFGRQLGSVEKGLVSTHSVEDAPCVSKTFPLLLFSPGLGLSPYVYATQLEDIASHGYVVAAIAHVADTTTMVLRNGKLLRFDEALWRNYPPEPRWAKFYAERATMDAKDLVFVLNRMRSLLRGKRGTSVCKFDERAVGAFGHSQGGRIAAAACQLDPRIRACLNEDGRLDLDQLGRPYWPVPGHHIAGSFAMLDWFDPGLSASDYRAMHTTAEAYSAAHLRPGASALESYRAVEGDAFRITLLYKGMAHTAFTDERFLQAVNDASRAESAVNLSVISEVVVRFFDFQLRGRLQGKSFCATTEPGLIAQCFKQK